MLRLLSEDFPPGDCESYDLYIVPDLSSFQKANILLLLCV